MRRVLWPLWMSASTGFGLACGNAGVAPASPDADIDAQTCSCLAPDLLPEDRLARGLYSVAQSSGPTGILARCEAPAMLLSGTCTVSDPEHNVILVHGFDVDKPDQWECTYDGFPVEITVGKICLKAMDAVEQPASDLCECPEIEPLEERIIRIERTGSLLPGTVMDFESACPDDGSVLVGGACALDYVETATIQPEAALFNAGVKPGEPNTWTCSWNKQGAAMDTAEITAICLRPPRPGTATEAHPLIERIVQVTEVGTLPRGAGLVEASCALGDVLLGGGCTVESSEPPHDELTLYRSGFLDPSDNRTGTWQCAWYNPTDTQTTVVTTAICAKPPAKEPL